MSEVDARVEAFFTKAGPWREELAALRAILLDSPLTEQFKWRSPCYTWRGGNVATIWGFKDDCVIGFFKGVLLKDPDGVLAAPGENSRSVRIMRFRSIPEIVGSQAALRAFIQNAVEVEAAGLKVDLPKDDLELPEELVDRLDGDPDLREAFETLTPGRRRGYVLHFSQPKHSATREARIAKCAPRILEGKGMQDR
jgi:uncharacterized protein YdeI (YjbR/CyaY-like superfamily)